jgi:hypothetical protein
MIDGKEWHWREYQSLREEIRDADRANYQVLGILIAAAVAVVTAGFGQRDPSARLVIFARERLPAHLPRTAVPAGQ